MNKLFLAIMSMQICLRCPPLRLSARRSALRGFPAPTGEENTARKASGERERHHAKHAVRRDAVPRDDEAERQRKRRYDDPGNEPGVHRSGLPLARGRQ